MAGGSGKRSKVPMRVLLRAIGIQREVSGFGITDVEEE